MPYQIHALPIDPFAPLFALPDEALRAKRIRRVVADGISGFPCRVSMLDAVAGETLLLLTYDHHPVDSPYRASGPIYVREGAERAHPRIGEVPELLRSRLLSLRAYDAKGMMRTADVVPGMELEAGIAAAFANERVSYLHLHYAKPGCYACRIERA